LTACGRNNTVNGGEPKARKKRAGKGEGTGRNRQDVSDSDYLLDAAMENWPHILRAYR
jgi:hypothetical protein